MMKSEENVSSPIYADRAWNKIKDAILQYRTISYYDEHGVDSDRRFRSYIDQMAHWCDNWINTDNKASVVQQVNEWLLTIDANTQTDNVLCRTSYQIQE
eukprot:12429227-Karenia_brevis.AAC.1